MLHAEGSTATAEDKTRALAASEAARSDWDKATQSELLLIEQEKARPAAYFTLIGRFFATFSPKTGAFGGIWAEKSGHFM